jgi:hypothetical protein
MQITISYGGRAWQYDALFESQSATSLCLRVKGFPGDYSDMAAKYCMAALLSQWQVVPKNTFLPDMTTGDPVQVLQVFFAQNIQPIGSFFPTFSGGGGAPVALICVDFRLVYANFPAIPDPLPPQGILFPETQESGNMSGGEPSTYNPGDRIICTNGTYTYDWIAVGKYEDAYGNPYYGKLWFNLGFAGFLAKLVAESPNYVAALRFDFANDYRFPYGSDAYGGYENTWQALANEGAHDLRERLIANMSGVDSNFYLEPITFPPPEAFLRILFIDWGHTTPYWPQVKGWKFTPSQSGDSPAATKFKYSPPSWYGGEGTSVAVLTTLSQLLAAPVGITIPEVVSPAKRRKYDKRRVY